ncbi:MAG: hypothetical protein U0936_20750 [Planctomycetaceae bacterium]
MLTCILVTELLKGAIWIRRAAPGTLPIVDAVECVDWHRGRVHSWAWFIAISSLPICCVPTTWHSKDSRHGAGRTPKHGVVAGLNLTGTGVMMGTAAYMPPEQAREHAQADARSTVFIALAARCFICGWTNSVYRDDSDGHDSVCESADSIAPANQCWIDMAADRIFQRLVAKSPDGDIAFGVRARN